MKIFSFSTYHKYFYKTLPVLLIYSVLLGYLLDLFELHEFFFVVFGDKYFAFRQKLQKI